MNRIGAALLGVFCMACTAEGDGANWKTLRANSSDGVILEAQWLAGRGRGGWLLIHGLGSVKEEWKSFAEAAQQQGWSICIVDLRGHGKSQTTRQGGRLNYQTFRTIGPGSEWSKMVPDFEPILTAYAAAANLPKQRISIGGASLGANLALSYASLHPEVPAVLLLSPGMEYAGISIEPAYSRWANRPLFMVASPNDSYSFATVENLSRRRSDPALYVASGQAAQHGVQMLDSAMTEKLLHWMGSLK